MSLSQARTPEALERQALRSVLSGEKTGSEIYWSRDGRKLWQWEHNDDGSSVWTQYWPNGKKKSESTWKDFRCEGIATLYENDGKVIKESTFKGGLPVTN